jgi:hypothetical protein
MGHKGSLSSSQELTGHYPEPDNPVHTTKHYLSVINITITAITILDIIPRPVFYLKTQNFGDEILFPSSESSSVDWAQQSRNNLMTETTPSHR